MAIGPTERTYYAVVASYSLWAWFMAPIYPLFLASRGLDLFQVNLVLVAYLVTSTVFEVPTGAVADLFGRKRAFILSCVVRMVAFGLYYFAKGLGECLVAEVIDAIGTTLASGALDAWAVDGMLADGAGQPTARLFARAQVLGRAMMIAGGVASGYVADRDIGMPWVVGAVGFGLTGVLAAVRMRELPRVVTAGAPRGRNLRQTSVAATRLVGGSSTLLGLYALSFALAFAGFSLSMTWPPRLKELAGSGYWVLGWVWAAINLAAVIGGTVAPRLAGLFRREAVMTGATLLRGAGVLGAALVFGPGRATAGLVLAEAGFAINDPLLNAWVNEHVGSELRATVLSVRGMVVMLGGAIGLSITGWTARGYGIPASWLLCAAVYFAVAAIPLRIHRAHTLPG